jgi:hypothetical protein
MGQKNAEVEKKFNQPPIPSLQPQQQIDPLKYNRDTHHHGFFIKDISP